MPFTDVYGNGGLLTTVGDMLRWNEALSAGTIPGGRPLVELLETRGTTQGKPIAYALGLSHGTWQGQREIGHSGSTAGYSTYLTRFPDARVSVAVFCNATDAGPTLSARQVAALLLPPPPARAASTGQPSGDSTVLRAVAGRYRDPLSDELAEFRASPTGLQMRTPFGGGLVTSTGTGRFASENGVTFEFSGAAPGRRLRVTDADGRTRQFEELVTPDSATLRLDEYVGTYESPELRIRYTMVIENGQLVVRSPPFLHERLTPHYRDGFVSGGRTVRFVRDESGRVAGFRIYAGRVRAVRFDRLATPGR
jgi:hypothetical protein